MDSGILVAAIGTSGVAIGAIVGFLGFKANARAQERVTEIKAQADMKMQADRLRDAATSSELEKRIIKLEGLHAFLSEMGTQCSQTQAMLDYQSGRDLEKHTARWMAQLTRLHAARADADIHFPTLSEGLAKVSSCIDCFNWECREFLRTDFKSGEGEDNQHWQVRFGQIIKESNRAAEVVWDLKRNIKTLADQLVNIKR